MPTSRFFIPDELTEKGPDAVSSRKAEWAQTFLPSSTGSQTIRYKKDINEYVGQLQDSQAAHLQEAIQTNKVAQDAYFKQRELEQREKLAAEALSQRHQQFEAQQALAVQRLDADHARTAAETARQAREMALQKHKDLQSAAADFDTAGFIHGELDAASKLKRNTPEYHEAVMQLHGQFPAADAQHKAPYLRSAEAFFSARAPAPKVTVSTIESRDPDFPNNPPVTGKKTVITGTPEEVQRLEQESAPTTGADFLNSLGVQRKQKPPVIVPGSHTVGG